MDIQTLLLEFSARFGVTGCENELGAAEFAAQQLGRFGEVSTTPLGSVVCTVRKPKPNTPHILLDAHLDEIGLTVASVGEKGFVRVGPRGGIDRRLMAASPVTIHTGSRSVHGVVCSTPPHLSGNAEKINPKIEDLWVDIGLDEEAARKAVSPGDIITIDSHPRALLGGLVSGKALDDRAGCVSLLAALDFLGDAPLDCGLTVCFSSMEEVGGQGAKTAAYQIAPSHAIVVDVSFAHTPDARKDKCGELRKGPMIGFSPALDRAMSHRLTEIARANDIPYQYEVMGGQTGTNADEILTVRGGVKCALLSVPQKYMHTPIEVVAVQDVENTGRLIADYLKATWGGK